MNITTRFNVNETAWHVSHVRERIVERCPVCEGEGILLGKDNSEQVCLKCHGGELTKEVHLRWKPVVYFLRSLKIEVDADGIRFAYYNSHGCCGTTANDETLFATQEECEAECARLEPKGGADAEA